jgi:hypothetical protein
MMIADTFRSIYRSCQSSLLIDDSVYKLYTTDLALLQRIETIKHAGKTTRTDLDRVHNKLLASEELRGQVPELLCKLEVLQLGRHVHAIYPLESLAGKGVAKRSLCIESVKKRDGSDRSQLTLFSTSVRR